MALLLDAAQHVALAFLGASTLLLVSYLTETATYKALKWLENTGAIERLSPHIPTSITGYQRQTAVTTFWSSWFVLMVALHPKVYRPLIALAQPEWDWPEIAATCWLGVAVHDFQFFAIHTVLHRTKWLYRLVHITHHKLGGDLTVFGTADMDPFEAVAMVFSFYAGMLLLYVWLGRWNPVAYVAFLLLEANMNQMGHCGYRQPWWLAVIQSWGVCFTPGVAHAKTHYIHHLDPRYNRALYFSWWDRVAGTWKDQHPYIKEFTPEQQWEYELRGPRILLGHLSKSWRSAMKMWTMRKTT